MAKPTTTVATFGLIEKPQEVWQQARDSPKLNVWCTLRKSCIINYFICNAATVNGKCYCAMLQDFLIPERQQFNIYRRNLLSARQCTLPRCFECATFIEWRLLRQVGTISWPSRSPDLTPLDYILRGHVTTVCFNRERFLSRNLRSRSLMWFMKSVNSK